MQIFGSDPDVMAQAAAVVEEAGADIVDINMGCPVKKVVKNGDGSALMKNLPLAESHPCRRRRRVHPGHGQDAHRLG